MKDLNKYILGILKKMVKNPNIRKTETWTESKKEMVSIMTKKIQKIKMDQHFKDVDVNDFQMRIYSSVSWFSLLTFQKTSFQGILSIARVTETKNATNFPSIWVAYSFSSSSQLDL